MLFILKQYLITFGWAITGAVSMAIGLGVMLKIFSLMTKVDEWEQIEKGNIAVAIILAAVVLGTSLVIALVIMG